MEKTIGNPAKTHRTTSIIVGALYIIGTISGILSLVFSDPVRSAQDQLLAVSANEPSIILGALFVLIMGLALAMVPVLMYPILKKQNPVLALGYVVFRGGFEAVADILVALGWLLLVPLSHVYSPGAENASNLQALGRVLLDSNQLGSILSIVFIIGALMFYTLLFQTRLVPRWLSGWGLVAALPNLASTFLALFNLTGSLSSLAVYLEIPLALQEMVMALWLIIRGFKLSALEVLNSK